MRRRWWLRGSAAVVCAVVVVALVVVAHALWDRAHRTDFEQALATVPAGSARISFTDWAAVRRTLHLPTVADPGPKDLHRLMSRAYDKDFSAASSLDDYAAVVQRHYGFSPANADWEAYGQSRKGAAMVMRMPDDFGFGGLADTLRSLGYRPPHHATGVWRGSPNLVASIDPTLTPEVQNVVLLPDQHLLVTSDTPSYAARAGAVAGGGGRPAADVESVSQMASRSGDPAAAVVWTRAFACRDLSMSKAATGDQARASQLVRRAGTVSPLSGLVMAMGTDRDLTVAEQFESSDQARENLRARARLAVGEAVGRGTGTFADQFRLSRAATDGSTVLLTLHPRRPSSFVLSALYDGPVLFATC
ncbi:MAG: hypothetical protein ACRDPH_01400 [Marmoricola sp.]